MRHGGCSGCRNRRQVGWELLCPLLWLALTSTANSWSQVKRDSPTESSTQRRFSHLRPADPPPPQIREFPRIIRGNIPFLGRRIHKCFYCIGNTHQNILSAVLLIDYTHSTLWMYLTSYNPSTSSLSSKYINGGGGGRSR